MIALPIWEIQKRKKKPTNCKWEVTWFKEFILQTSLFNEVIKICFYQSMYNEFIRCQHESWTYESWYFHETEYFLLPDNIFGLRQSYLPKTYSKHWPYTVAYTSDCVISNMLNHGLNQGLLLSFFKLTPCTIHWIVYVLANLNFIFEFSSSFSTAQNGSLCPDTWNYKFHLNCLEHSIFISQNNIKIANIANYL